MELRTSKVTTNSFGQYIRNPDMDWQYQKKCNRYYLTFGYNILSKMRAYNISLSFYPTSIQNIKKIFAYECNLIWIHKIPTRKCKSDEVGPVGPIVVQTKC